MNQRHRKGPLCSRQFSTPETPLNNTNSCCAIKSKLISGAGDVERVWSFVVSDQFRRISSLVGLITWVFDPTGI